MSWEERPLEKHVEWLIKNKLGERGKRLWTNYEATRTEVVDHVLPWIKNQAPDLTDHGIDHIQDVIDRASELMGFINQYCIEAERPIMHDFTPDEMYVLLCGLLFHDVGNIFGRNKHNLKIADVWSKLPTWGSWTDNDRNIIIEVGRAHSGLTLTGATDTLKPLSVSSRYFCKQPVRLGPIAAVIRFADELAEGPQRTSRLLIDCKLIDEGSELYHHYAQITQVAIDRKRGLVALTFHINVDNSAYPVDEVKRRSHLSALLKMVYSRAAKMNNERQFARHYADVLMPFRETSISLTFQKTGQPLGIGLEPITLNDFSSPGDLDGLIEKVDQRYLVGPLVDSALGVKNV
ncbi:HD domain-containing protein [Rhodoferax ferrireducens]|uniref:HD domain-containing protein n=1 Tax=Rhodoferax ferrireducens TaxID=192843 RepID=UPI003BB636CC